MKNREEMEIFIINFDKRELNVDSTEKIKSMTILELLSEYKATIDVYNLLNWGN